MFYCILDGIQKRSYECLQVLRAKAANVSRVEALSSFKYTSIITDAVRHFCAPAARQRGDTRHHFADFLRRNGSAGHGLLADSSVDPVSFRPSKYSVDIPTALTASFISHAISCWIWDSLPSALIMF